MSNLDALEIELARATAEMARAEATALREQLQVVRDVVADSNAAAGDRMAYLTEKLG